MAWDEEAERLMLQAIETCGEAAAGDACVRAFDCARRESGMPGDGWTAGATVTPGAAILAAVKVELRRLLTVH
jgi:hypothetical protein